MRSNIDDMSLHGFPSHINEHGQVQTSTEHCRNTAAIAERLIRGIGLGRSGYCAGLLHDCGKFSEEFSTYITRASKGEKVCRGSVIHSFAGVVYLLNNFDRQSGDYRDLTAEILAYSVGCHHGLFDCIDMNGRLGFEHRLSKQPHYDHGAISNFLSQCAEENELERIFEEAVEEMIPVIDLCRSELAKEQFDVDGKSDWGDQEFLFYIGLLTRMVASALIDADRIDTHNYMSETKQNEQIMVYDWKGCLDRINAYLHTFPSETALQCARRRISDACEEAAAKAPGVYRLNIPTGGGKTLSGLRYAVAHAEKYKKDRVFYVAPLLSILDQNASVIYKAVQDETAILEHHSNIIRESEGTEDEASKELLIENWNSPIIITTLVQFLNSLFGGKTSQIRRFHALCNSVIILDEVQSVPTKMMSLFNLAVNFLAKVCKATIILCSATQPLYEELDHSLLVKPESLVSDQFIKKWETVFHRNTIINKGIMKIAEIPGFLESLEKDYHSILLVCNTKSEAVRLVNEVQSQTHEIFHLSASMYMAHRKRILTELEEALRYDKKVICISTQVIEAGVDISFDCVIRLCAGMDSIIQSAGRCNRNGDLKDAPVYIVNCTDENLSHLEDIKRGQDATNGLLHSFAIAPGEYDNDLGSQKSIERFYRIYYKQMKKGHTDYVLPKDGTDMVDLLSENTKYSALCGENGYLLSQAFKTAGQRFQVLDNNQITVIVECPETESIIADLMSKDEKSIETVKIELNKLKPYTVSVYDYQRKILDSKGALTYYSNDKVEIIVLDKMFYSNLTGLSNNGEVKEECDILIL